MTIKDGQIAGVVVRDLERHSDSRGWLVELYRSDELNGEYLPVMGYVSSTEPGVVRGPHEHRDQADCFAMVGPSTFRVFLWDKRPGSSTFGTRMIVEAGENLPRLIIIPKGIVHAYKNIGAKPGWVLNFANRLYAGKGRKEAVDEIRHEDDPETEYRID